jgi:hypothetical protein
MLRAPYASFPDGRYDHDPVEVRADAFGNQVAAERDSHRHLAPWR